MPRMLRPDLAQVDVHQVTPYIASRILPPLYVGQKVGNLYYMAVQADSAAQTGRTLGAAPTAVTLAATSDTFSCAERIKRVQVPDSEIRLHGGNLQRAQESAARVGKRSICRSLEDAVEALLQAQSGEDILDSLLESIDTGIDAIQRVPGTLAFICGWTTFRRITRFSEITNTLLRTGVPTAAMAQSVRNIDAPTLASILGVQEVLVGDDDHWAAGEAYLVKLPDPSVDPVEVPQIGRVITYVPEEMGGGPFEMASYYDDQLITEVVDTRCWDDPEIYNATGIYKLYGIDEGNAVTTSTTST